MQQIETLADDYGCHKPSICSVLPVASSPASSSSTGTGLTALPTSSSEYSSAATESPLIHHVSVGPFVFEEARIRSMEMLAKPDAHAGPDESRDRSKSARKALANSGRRPTSSFKGVNLHCRSNRWETHIWDGHQVHVGCFDTELQAAIAYDIVAIKLRGAKAKLNFAAGSYNTESAALDKMSRDEVLMAMRGVTMKEEPAGGEARCRDSSPPRTRKHARQASTLATAVEPSAAGPKKRRRLAPASAAAKQANKYVRFPKPKPTDAAAAVHMSVAPSKRRAVECSVRQEIDGLSEPERKLPAIVLGRSPVHQFQCVQAAAVAAPDSPTLVHRNAPHPSDLMVNHQSTIWTTQDTCSLLPSHWLSHSSDEAAADLSGCFALGDGTGRSHSGMSSDTDVSDIYFEDLEGPGSVGGSAVEEVDWQVLDFSPGMLLLDLDYVEPWLQG